MALELGPYPLRYAVEYPERLSHWLIFVKWFLAIPHYVILWALGWVQSIITLVASLVILVTTRYPRELPTRLAWTEQLVVL